MTQQKHQIFDSVSNAVVAVGGGNDRSESPRTRLALTVMAHDNSNEEGEPREVQLWLTIPQVVEIVIGFFFELTNSNFYAKNLLRQLLRKRHSFMTSPVYKSSRAEEEIDSFRYYRKLEKPGRLVEDFAAQAFRDLGFNVIQT